jgi:hypothetical protein
VSAPQPATAWPKPAPRRFGQRAARP